MPLTQSYRTQSVFLTLVRPGRPQKQAVARSDDAVMLLEHVTNTERGYSVLDQLDLMGTDHPNASLSQAAQHKHGCRMAACASNTAMRASSKPVTPLAAIRCFVLIGSPLANTTFFSLGDALVEVLRRLNSVCVRASGVAHTNRRQIEPAPTEL
jgi:hypothetical protein